MPCNNFIDEKQEFIQLAEKTGNIIEGIQKLSFFREHPKQNSIRYKQWVYSLMIQTALEDTITEKNREERGALQSL